AVQKAMIQIFGIPLDQDAGENLSYSSLYSIIEDFFTKLIVTQQLDEEATVASAQALGARHIDFVGKGFNASFWDIFMACLRDELHESMETYGDGDDHELTHAFEKTFAWVLYNMRSGFHDRKKKESEARIKLEAVAEEVKEKTVLERKPQPKKIIEKKKCAEEAPTRCRCS
ncbi:hypothetical protein PMAYCL1PPCAC_26288, partial [Pristionchus mayeri]